MTSVDDESALVMPARYVTVSRVPRTDPRSASQGHLHPGISLLREWPQRVALVVGVSPEPLVLQSLDSLGFRPVIVRAEAAEAAVQALSPFAFLVLSADVMASGESVDAVRMWRRFSPSARVKLMCGRAERDSELLVRAIQAGVTDVVDPRDAPAVVESLRAGMIGAGAIRERVLAIGAHPDDVEIGCAGTLIDHRRRDDRISILTLSQGSRGGDLSRRVAEAGAAADAMGAQLMMADLPDTEIDGGVTTIRLIESVVAAIDPTVVYVHSEHDNHQDHRAVSAATRSATRGVRRVFAYQSPSATNEFKPTQFTNVDQTLRAKVATLSLFDSQRGRTYLEPELIVAGARYWARHLGANARYAEPFEVVRSVGELRHTAASPQSPADDERVAHAAGAWNPRSSDVTLSLAPR